ncbi:MAG: AAA family ATPase [Deltaproteobacteria bacterium CG_4_10_14_0_2_um_filter_43_8]|nr:MAG: AAA family ATPase [Deltaproteobacteria bacterium CG11_big_fil_rev_8_21_14_0_20_42_23]PJA18963.1 MAG: AAA family ATPase [Deltaproteobacteria bacterium CG_4_10_14_0_2_um_filter_43_8]PJC63584.1 MAG: AAA family ATPase [Deltaproteobacteria bacterium CG_4_9_14_0_2_um_filter_42_21]
MSTLFDQLGSSRAPLAERMRPSSLDEVVGQEHLIGEGKSLSLLLQADTLPSFIFWGPSGTGKTTLAKIIARHTKAHFFQISAVLSGVQELREVIKQAKEKKSFAGNKSILFIDEIHRWNKAQQDALLPHVEDGTITLIGSTTENPSFEIISALLSRTKVFVLEPLDKAAVKKLLNRSLENTEQGLGQLHFTISDDALDFIADQSDGDARRALTTLEIAANLLQSSNNAEHAADTIDLKLAEQALQKKSLVYDKGGEEHYNVISAFIKSMRGSDPDAAIYYLARMLEAGEDPLFVARRMVIFASEDVSNADPQAVQVAIACMESFKFVGMPEGWIPLAQAASYLASAPKSNASYMAYKKAKMDIQETGTLPTPKHLRNAPTKLMKEMGYGKNYKYAHEFENNVVPGEQYLPDQLKKRKYYSPTENGYERVIKERLERIRKLT